MLRQLVNNETQKLGRAAEIKRKARDIRRWYLYLDTANWSHYSTIATIRSLVYRKKTDDATSAIQAWRAHGWKTMKPTSLLELKRNGKSREALSLPPHTKQGRGGHTH